MQTLRRWNYGRKWSIKREPVYLDSGSASFLGEVSKLDLITKACFAKVLKESCEVGEPSHDLGSNHFNSLNEGLYEHKCGLTRIYWYYHGQLADTVILLSIVRQGKTIQKDDLAAARQLRLTA